MTKQEIKQFIADYLFEEMEFSDDEDFKESVVGELNEIDISCALAGRGGIYNMRGKSGWCTYCRPVPKKVVRDMTIDELWGKTLVHPSGEACIVDRCSSVGYIYVVDSWRTIRSLCGWKWNDKPSLDGAKELTIEVSE